MPVPNVKPFPAVPQLLINRGIDRVKAFCRLNPHLTVPQVTVVDARHWVVLACAFYRPKDWGHVLPHHGPEINICLPHCGTPCPEAMCRNWSWPGNVTDRTVYGVVTHEFAHHADWLTGSKKGAYFSDYGESVMTEANEKPLTSYAATNPAEWFAEAFRLFVTNPALLKALRPGTHRILCRKFRPLPGGCWKIQLGPNVPARVVRAIHNKGVI